MKENLRRLNAALKLFTDELELFYSNTAGRHSIALQAEFHSKLVKKIIANKFKQLPVNANGYLEFIRGNITITLT